MIILLCSDCGGTRLYPTEDKRFKVGEDVFKCKDCGNVTTLKLCGCREENDYYE